MTNLISHFELKHLRKAIGASVSRMAELLGLSGDNAADTIRKMENGSKPISGPLQRIARFMQEGVEEGSMSITLPKFMICDDLAGELEFEWIFHTRYPRFLAVVTNEPHDSLLSATEDGIEWLSVAMWIDEPVDSGLVHLKQAASYFAKYSDDALQNNDEN